MGVIWTCEGTRKMVKANGSTIIKLPDTAVGVLLVLAHSVKIRPGGHLTVPLECTQPVTDQMDIRIDIGFHHKNPNVYIPPSYVNNPNNQYKPKYMPLTIFNLSRVDHLYIGKDTVIAFADTLEFDTYNVEIAREEQIKEHLAKPRNWVPQGHETLPEIPPDTAFICLQQMYLDTTRSNCRIKKSLVIFARGLKSFVKSMDRHSQNIMRTSAEPSLSRWM